MRLTERVKRSIRSVGEKTSLNCIAELDPTAHDQAEALEECGEKNLPLYGVPVLVKDNIDVMGLHTTAGSLALEDNTAGSDAPIVRNLRRNGAVILGKTNMTEFANYVTRGMPGGYSSRGGRVVHAVSPRLSVSGSSSGSAVAVAAGIVPMAVGTDTSFSIIACAQANGICGLKPPAGALSGEGIIPIARTLDSAGAMARTVSDALKLYSAMRQDPLPEMEPACPEGLRLAVNLANGETVPEGQVRFLRRFTERAAVAGAVLSELTQGPVPELKTIMRWEFRPMLEAYLERAAASRKTLAEIVEYYESHPETMMRYGDLYLREALDCTPGGLHGKPYLEAMETRMKTRGRVAQEIAAYDAVIMTGPTNIMHFCGLPSVTVSSDEKDEKGVSRCVILYGLDERRLYGAALLTEKLINTDPFSFDTSDPGIG